MPDKTSPSLRTYLLGFVLLTGLLAAAAMAIFGERRLDRYESEILETVAEQRAQAIARLFARALTADWRQMSALARRQVGASTEELRAALDLIVGDGRRISWAGFARPDGTVVAASGGLLEGRSVATRPWFQRGLEGDFAGDVHDAVLLGELLPQSPDGRLKRFLDLATPVPGGVEGVPAGVLGLHVNERWARDYLAETAGMLGAEAVIVSRDRSILLGPDELVGKRFDLPSLRTAMAGAAGAVVETWPDGRRWLTSVVPEVRYEELPSFGWSLVARIDPAGFAAARNRLDAYGWLLLAALGLGLVVATLAFARIFLKPISDLASAACAVADGHETYPHENRRTREGAMLSTALARLENRVTGG